MQAIHTSASEIQSVVRQAFPDYTGKRFEVQAFNGPMTLTSCWDSGSRDYWAITNLATGKTYHVPENGNPFVNGGKKFKVGRLPFNLAIVRWAKGRYEHTTVFVHPDNLNRLALPPTVELTWAEKVVLCSTRSYKSSYAGVKDYRFYAANRELGIQESDYYTAKQSLISKGLLNKAGAITDDGKNAISNTNLYQLKN